MVAIDIANAGPLQAAIQKRLVEHGYSPDDDNVMAEYVTVMLANSKTAEQITSELQDLIGLDYDASFTDWIFEHAIPENYGSSGTSTTENGARDDTQTQVPEQVAQQQQHQTSSIETVSDSREGQGRYRNGNNATTRIPTGPRGGQGPRNGQGGVFGSAMSSLKREGDRDGYDRPARRPRMSEEGPKGNGPSIFERAGVKAGTALPNNFQNMGGRQFQNGPRRSFPGPPPSPFGQGPAEGFQQGQAPVLPPLHIPDNFNQLPLAQQQAIQQQIFQHQLIAAAAAQQMFGRGPPGSPFAQVPHQPSQPLPSPQPPQQLQPLPQGAQQAGLAPPVPSAKTVTIPKAPTSEDLCKYGVDCRNAACGYSHPSPAATKDSGLVLSKDGCEKNLDCEDKDCPKSHVSPAQKTDPQGRNAAQYIAKAKPRPQTVPATPVPTPVAKPASAQLQPLNPGAKPCMFASACTRPGCFFSHPPTSSNSGPAATPCRFALACTRPDCHFSHPPGHRRSGGPPKHHNIQAQKNRSATFNEGVSSGKDGLEGKEDVKIDDSKMSARMKKFLDPDSHEGDKERILPGSGIDKENDAANQNKSDGLQVVV